MRALVFLLILGAVDAPAAPPAVEPAVRQVEADLAVVTRERQSLSESVRMNRELRALDLSEVETAVPQAAVVMSAPLRNYDDVVRAEQERRSRIEGFDGELRRLRDEAVVLASRERELREYLRELLAVRRQ